MSTRVFATRTQNTIGSASHIGITPYLTTLAKSRRVLGLIPAPWTHCARWFTTRARKLSWNANFAGCLAYIILKLSCRAIVAQRLLFVRLNCALRTWHALVSSNIAVLVPTGRTVIAPNIVVRAEPRYTFFVLVLTRRAGSMLNWILIMGHARSQS